MNFEFSSAGRIVFGCGKLSIAGDEASLMGSRAFVVTGKSVKRVKPLLEILSSKKIGYEIYSISCEPTIEIIRDAAKKAKGCDLVISMGGGSVIDTGKAVSALMTNKGDLMDYLEVIGKGASIKNTPAPFIAIPTTAGTGTEVTRNSVIGSPEHGVKVSMRSPYMMPDLAIVDPDLTIDMPPSITASTGLDALTQLIEAFVSIKANPMTDGLCREGLKRASRSLLTAFENGDDISAREDMCIASLFSGIALANAGLGAVHGFAGPLGGMINAAHGKICAALLPNVMEVNLCALKERMPDSSNIEKYRELFSILSRNGSDVNDGVQWIIELCKNLKVKGLCDLGFDKGMVDEAVLKGKRASSMKGNPIELNDHELEKIILMSI